MKDNTFSTQLENKILTVTFDNPPVNIQDVKMINDLITLTDDLNKRNDITRNKIIKLNNPLDIGLFSFYFTVTNMD